MEHMNADFTLAVVSESNCVTTSNSANLDDVMTPCFLPVLLPKDSGFQFSSLFTKVQVSPTCKSSFYATLLSQKTYIMPAFTNKKKSEEEFCFYEKGKQ